MRITIPNHLRNIEVINQMYSMLSSYAKDYGNDVNSNFDILDNRAYDYIYEFLKIVLPENDEPTNRYLANLFYKCKGTTKVFDYLEDYMGLVYEDKPEYNIDRLVIKFESVTGTNLLNFVPALTNFLNALLYFNDLKIAIDKFKLCITSNISNRSSNMCVYYKDNYFEFK
jgi:hypothetical protein